MKACISNSNRRSNRGEVHSLVAILSAAVILSSQVSGAFFNVPADAPGAPDPRNPVRNPVRQTRSASIQGETKSAKLVREKERLLREIKEIEMKLAVTLLEENTVPEEPEEYDPELSRLRRKYNIKAVPDAPAGSDTAARREFHEMQPVREVRGTIAQLALLRAATEDDDWNCDEACLAALAGDSKLPSADLQALDSKLQADVRKVQQKLMQLEFTQRLQFSHENRRRITWLYQFLKVVPSLREKVLC